MNQLKAWMKVATKAEQLALAARCHTSRSYLYSLASGQRIASAEMAGRIEDATRQFKKETKHRLPVITRGDLSPACRHCPYSPDCHKE